MATVVFSKFALQCRKWQFFYIHVPGIPVVNIPVIWDNSKREPNDRFP